MTVCRIMQYCYYGYSYRVTLCIGQLHPTTIYRTGCWVCAVLVLSVIMCSFHWSLCSVLFNHDGCNYCNYYRYVYGHDYSFWPAHLGLRKICRFDSVTTHLPGCSSHWTFVLNIGLNTLSSDSFVSCLDSLQGVSGFATDCPCGFWCRGLTICLLWVGPLFGNLVWNDSGFVSWHNGEQFFSVIIVFVYMYLRIS